MQTKTAAIAASTKTKKKDRRTMRNVAKVADYVAPVKSFLELTGIRTKSPKGRKDISVHNC